MTLNELKSNIYNQGGNLSGVYKITRKSDNKIYIGQSICIVDRIMQHINNKSSRNNGSDSIDKALQKDGWQNFTYEVLLALPDMTSEQLWKAECDFIYKFDSFKNGFNLTQGNHNGKYNHTYEKRFHVVSERLCKKIIKKYNIKFSSGKSVLLIGCFNNDFIRNLKWNEVNLTIMTENYENKDQFKAYVLGSLETLENKHFDIIIANPPYGDIGANITKYIIDNIDFDDYINLLPVNDYKKNDTKDLYQFVELDGMEFIKKGEFTDATVTTHMARISKKRHTYISWEEFQIENYIDPQLTKYFYENLSRIQNLDYKDPSGRQPDKWVLDRTILIGWRDGANHHMPYTKDAETYHWNLLEDLDVNEFIKSKNRTRAKANGTFELCYFAYTFKTALEKTNIAQFIYSDLGFKFIAKAFTAENSDGNKELFIDLALPKVDWSHSWTVEEILKDYGYTAKEIQAVMEDLKNYKGMED